jgi:hypothetical protein
MVSVINTTINNKALCYETCEITGEYWLLEGVSEFLTILSILYIFPRGRGILFKSVGVKKALHADIPSSNAKHFH